MKTEICGTYKATHKRKVHILPIGKPLTIKSRFQIDYNDQHVRFNSAFLLRFTVIEDSTHNQ